MNYKSINPYTGEVLKEFETQSNPDLSPSEKAFNNWRKLSITDRGVALKKVADLLENNKEKYARLITTEMGKPLREAEYEITKSLTAFDYYIENAPKFLANDVVITNASKSYIAYEPLGIILLIMPWNFPFWQVFRCAVPALLAGNVIILKHSQNVCQCAQAIDDLFKEAGIEEDIFKNHFLSNDDAGKLIADKRVKGLSFTGSDVTGSKLAEQAGRNLKKVVMELGGNDPFIVMDDADLDFAIAGAIKSRSINSGQSCNAAKRFIVIKGIAKAFTEKLVNAVNALKMGNPLDADTQTGPLARVDLAEKVRRQINDSVSKGAVKHVRENAMDKDSFVTPVVLTNVKKGMPAADEEIFGPVWSVIEVNDINEAIEVANDTVYGLGASLWTGDKATAEKYIPELYAGNVFINDIVKSDARLPFGGVGQSGYGRELSEYGIKEFVNIKTVYIN